LSGAAANERPRPGKKFIEVTGIAQAVIPAGERAWHRQDEAAKATVLQNFDLIHADFILSLIIQ
jgi:hypothetical protein